MTDRKRKKKNKLRGHRTMGKGDTKNRRGAGSRGGRGNAGSRKHKRQLFLWRVGSLRRLKPKKKMPAINLTDASRMLEKMKSEKEAKKEGNLLVFDGQKQRIGKILSVGTLLVPAVFRNVSASRRAAEKIEQAGGKIDLPRQTEQEESTGVEG